MSAEPSRAVFLSYASQDAEAAQRICAALRAIGVEVWFDQNELVGGDAWDAKIRGQIGSCALFVPIISANTQARLEGYFRIEWKLAARRTHGIAAAKAFLLPIVIDATRDAEAHVPDEFREVQWTKLPNGEATEKFCARVKMLIDGSAVDVSPVVDRAPGHRPGPQQTRAASRPWLIPTLIGAAVIFALAVWQPWKKLPVASSQSTAPAPAAAASKPGAETASDLADQARSRYYPFRTPASLQLADELSRRATELDPQYARGWGTRANASACYLLRGLVSGEAAQQRAREAQSYANRALSLDKNETEALVALGIVALHQHASTQAETLFRRVLTIDPNNVQAPSLLSMVLRETDRNAEALALMKRAVANAPRDPIVHLFLGFVYWAGWNFTKAAEQFDIAATVADFQGARVYQAWVVFLQTGDLARLRTMLESVDLIYSAEDSKLTYLLACGLFERRADRVIEAAGRTASTYFDGVAMPKAWFSALAYEFDHKDNLARQQWLAAEAVIRERLGADPQSEMLRINLAITLAKLGRTPEARTEFDAIEIVWREQLDARHALWLARFNAAVGDAPRAVALLRQGMSRLAGDAEGFQNATRRTLQFDPWWDPIRNTSEFRELLAHPPEPPAPIDEPTSDSLSAATPDDKSVAVLAFADLSAAHDSEYFSDGISDELINALGKVPGLKVPGRTSSFYFKGKNVPVPEIAQQLGVAYVIEGSVQRAGEKVKISARLSKAADGFQVWSDSFLRDAKDVFAVEDEIAGLIAKNLSLKLGASSAATTAAVKPEAFALYVQGRQLWNRRTEEDYVQAERLFNRALELEPSFARAYVGRADARVFLAARRGEVGTWGQRNARLLADIAADIQRALELDAGLAEAHASMGFLHSLRAERDAAVQEYLTAISLNPNYATAHQWLALEYWRQGRLAEARTAALAGVKADPFSSVVAAACSIVLQSTGDLSAAMAQAERALTLQPDSLRALGAKTSILFDLGRRDDALALARSIVGRDATTQGLGRALFVLGAAGEAGEVERARHVSGPLASLLELQGAAALGKWDEFFARWNASGLTVDDVWYLYMPALDPIRADARFLGLLKEAGLLEAHARFQAWRASHPPEKPEAKK